MEGHRLSPPICAQALSACVASAHRIVALCSALLQLLFEQEYCRTQGDVLTCNSVYRFAVSNMADRGLVEQDLSKLDVTNLHPLLPEVMSRQATINIGN